MELASTRVGRIVIVTGFGAATSASVIVFPCPALGNAIAPASLNLAEHPVAFALMAASAAAISACALLALRRMSRATAKLESATAAVEPSRCAGGPM